MNLTFQIQEAKAEVGTQQSLYQLHQLDVIVYWAVAGCSELSVSEGLRDLGLVT